ncbi:MAG: hypothetical protein KatS3mg117_2915 [Geminicoccaceae bacterium]|nr:MAG: hypothetical protein KatS3mg117_2915 [Geminicoccaceae bacterium]
MFRLTGSRHDSIETSGDGRAGEVEGTLGRRVRRNHPHEMRQREFLEHGRGSPRRRPIGAAGHAERDERRRTAPRVFRQVRPPTPPRAPGTAAEREAASFAARIRPSRSSCETQAPGGKPKRRVDRRFERPGHGRIPSRRAALGWATRVGRPGKSRSRRRRSPRYRPGATRSARRATTVSTRRRRPVGRDARSPRPTGPSGATRAASASRSAETRPELVPEPAGSKPAPCQERFRSSDRPSPSRPSGGSTGPSRSQDRRRSSTARRSSAG